MSNGSGDREKTVLAALAGVFATLVIVLGAVLVLRSCDGESVIGPGTSTTSTTTPSAATTATTTAPTSPATTTAPTPPATTTTTAAATTTTAAATTTTTAPFGGDTDSKACGAPGGDAGSVTDVRFSQRDGFTQVVFEFAGGTPGCNVYYSDPDTLAVIVYPASPAAGIFGGGDHLAVGTVSVIQVGGGGESAGSGEVGFTIDLVGTRDFRIYTMAGPSRLVVEVED